MKSKINLIIDGIMLILMSIIAGLGLLMKYVLVPGFKRNDIYGKDVELFWFGYDRHWWGNLHYILSIILVALIALHIILHWKMIVSIFERMVSIKGFRIAFGIILLVISIFLIVSTLFVKPQVEEEFSGHSHKVIQQDQAKTIEKQTKTNINDATPLNEKKHEHSNSEDIKGSMTLNEIAEKYNISADIIKHEMNIPTSVSNDSKAGRLKREYGFSIDELREVAERLKRQN